MPKSFIKRTIIFYLITVTIGTLSHFAFNFFNMDVHLKVLFPINESYFEHLKLFFYPFILTSIIEGLIYKENLKYFIAKRGFIISFIMLFELVYITLMTKIFGNNSFINISSYYILMLVGYFISYYLKEENKIILIGGYINIFLWLLAFAIFSYIPPKNRIFIDPTQSNV